MLASNRIIINTIAQYIRTILNTILSLYSSRLILQILGVEDFGIYSLIAGVVSMLSFFTNSLVGSTQRFLSVSRGKNDLHHLINIFSNSLLLHIILGLVICIFLSGFAPLLFNGFLNIDVDRIDVAQKLYYVVVWIVFVTFITAPFRALIISRESIVFISIIDVIDGILKVVLVLFLYYVTSDRLIAYGWIMMLIQLFNLISFGLFCFYRYEECVLPKLNRFDFEYLKSFAAYTGWITYSAGVIAFRTQGLAIVLNKTLGTAINAAYGIGSQIAGVMAFLGTSFNNAIAPQLMASEGSGDRNRMFALAEIESKFSFLLMSLLAIPTIFEIQFILKIWLVDVPNGAALFSCMFIIMQTIDMLSTGLGLANKAIGNVGYYTFITVTPKLLIVPFSFFLLKYNIDLAIVCFVMIIIETISMLLRIYAIRDVRGFNLNQYIKNVLCKSFIPVAFSVIFCYLCSFLDFTFDVFITYIVSIVVFLTTTYFFALNSKEKSYINVLVNKIKK